MPASRTTFRTPGVAGAVLAAVAVVALIAVGTALVVLTGTTSSGDERGGTDAGFAIDPISDDPTSVATVVMAGIYTWQPSVQGSTWDALRVQSAFLTGPMATAAAAPPTPAPRPISEWAGWARSDDTVTAAVEASGEAVVDGVSATVPVTISQTVLHRSRESTPFTTYTADVTLTRVDDSWKVANYRILSSSL
ncbi:MULTISPECIES: hypothetical protein [Nocardiaceae]|uniref:Mce-associated membrane protein n=1 Tax=Rhodococcoides kroppenstedtii TaxID=293050 RepID=A0ABS7NWJ5_9NOCA|nr:MULTISPECIES: hypothetical protein [Rhodococcus]AMY20713.1 hypothetical protein A3Q40_03352 [Rhodococcus sp. PBTS 1]MBY6313371.1 hypothetical protein [Rhodococcus kroppenstedtii]MBY6321262.1 hypothetical protein [Rhodococcus kroppenstedtii]MBY6400321.1 hypothetical protein [Rhodococcus kroppenstedtii]